MFRPTVTCIFSSASGVASTSTRQSSQIRHFSNRRRSPSLFLRNTSAPFVSRYIRLDPPAPQRRFSSTSAVLEEASNENNQSPHQHQQHALKEAQRSLTTGNSRRSLAYKRLRPVIDHFEAPIDWAVAYGSGVVHQANASSSLPPPLTDFIFSTPSASAFHIANIRQNPSHYPLYAQLLGGNVVGWIQERFGAGMWYVTMVKVRGIEIKYGVISTSTLVRDLETWDTLYVSGRLHKPVLHLISNPLLSPPFSSNLRSALALSLILLPPGPFTELALWEQIAGISYSGDPRMSVPGAENPQKVKNIVRGEDVLDGFRRLYEGILSEVKGLRKVNGDLLEWSGKGEDVFEQPSSDEHFASLLASLPLTLRQAIARHFRPTIVGSLVSPAVREERKSIRETGPLHEDPEFWLRVVAQDRFREVVATELRHIVRRPALTQSIKGLFTAGLFKSVQYSFAKFRKWLRGRQSSSTKKIKSTPQ